MKNTPRDIPTFESEDEEREFWATHDSTEYIDWGMATRVSDLSVDELRTIIQETVKQTFTELFLDPDDGLELQQDLKDALQRSLKAVQAGDETLSAESVADKLGLSW